ncbi:alanyl-tRNA editing protein [Cupriavidus basilensis]|uniref:Alanyl-tRNA editing protein n=1 Tax=Cupriavidus basilensis TaxID=68895 RepID=A0ABT6B046_9BURK|nr:alanyl-tRNA editing protein [Cupriavidus basilensis]MDF3838246.1 alanyl-tRNA editing protein [Cupriavidus basilensis]
MERRVYLRSDDLDMNVDVVGCSQAVDGTFHVELSATLIHPHGGGQPSDVGTIGQASVIRVIQVNDDVIHICDREEPIGSACIQVSSPHRVLHARLHSAGHLIGYCGERLGWKAVKAHHWPGEARVVFEAGQGMELMTADTIERLANEQVAAASPRYTFQEGQV